MSRTIIRYPGRPGRFVGPFGDEAVACEWFDAHGDGQRVTFLPLELPDPPPRRLPQIPRRLRLSPQHSGFTRVDELADAQGEWFLLGPDAMLPTGREISVYQRSEQRYVPVHIEHYVAERTVRHRDEDGSPGQATRYVLAAFTNVRKPEGD